MTGEMPDTTGERRTVPGAWVRVAEAAQLLGVSERTIRRWIHSGRLPKDDSGPVLLVGVSGERQATPGMSDTAGHLVELAELRVQVDMLTRQNEELGRDKDYWRQQAEAALVNQRLLLEAPKRRLRWPWERGGEE